MRRLFASRSFWFLAERVLSQGAGFAMIAVLARRFDTGVAAGFVAAFAFVSVLQPAFANACQPVAIRLWRDHGAGSFSSLWAGLQVAAMVIGAMVWASGGAAAAFCLVIAAAPLSLFAAPLIAGDRWRPVVGGLIAATAMGGTARIAALLAGEWELAAALLAFEPAATALFFALRADWRDVRRGLAAGTSALTTAAPPLILAMALTTLFWRGPVLMAERLLSPHDVLVVACALQLLSGVKMASNAVLQSHLGPISAGGDRRRAAIANVLAASALTGAIMLPISALFGAEILGFLYGGSVSTGGAVLIFLAPVAMLGGVWRLTEFIAAQDGAAGGLTASRLVAIAGLCGTGVAVSAIPDGRTLAAGVSASLALSALAAPFAIGSLRPIALSMTASICAVARRDRRPETAQAPSRPQGSQG